MAGGAGSRLWTSDNNPARTFKVRAGYFEVSGIETRIASRSASTCLWQEPDAWNPSARRSRLKFVWQSHDPSAGMIETTFAIGTPLKKQSGHYSGKNSYLYPPGLPRNTKYTHTE